MKRRLVILCLACALLLGGCSWPDGTYHSVTPHQEQSGSVKTDNLTVTNYEELVAVLEDVVARATESCIINAVNYDPVLLELNLESAARYIRNVYPIGAYAVEDMNFEVGSGSGKTAIAVTVSYLHSRTEIRKIRSAEDTADARKQIGEALEDYETVLVFQLQHFEQMDYGQIVQDYAMDNPRSVMETPQVTWEVYGIGPSRVVELTFAYQTSRDSLRAMQVQVKPVFDSAKLYVSGEGSQSQKFSQLYAFLMERFDYTLETSITPAYSLLRHGVGDGRAFAMVYAAMCRESDLECMVVTGTRSGEPWTWNIICQDGVYYHVDLLRCSENGRFRKQLDEEMTGYVWDYSAYPQCVRTESEAEITVPEDVIPEETVK